MPTVALATEFFDAFAALPRAQQKKVREFSTKFLANPASAAIHHEKIHDVFALIAHCHQMLGDLPAALNACSEGLCIDPVDAELHFRKAVLHRKVGQPAEAEAC
jgi:hypothetical protein